MSTSVDPYGSIGETGQPTKAFTFDRQGRLVDVDSTIIAAAEEAGVIKKQSYLHQPPDTSPPDSSYYSPVQTPYTLTTSPNSRERAKIEANYELRPRPIDLLRGGQMELLQSPPFLSGRDEYMDMNNDNSHVYGHHWNDMQTDRTLPSPTPSDEARRTRTRKANITNAQPDGGGQGSSVMTPTKSQPAARASRAPRKRKTPGVKPERPKLPKLTKPLSELTNEYHHLPIRNMESWVHRPAEVRWQEVEKRGGYVTRPMNSFMLYRSAFAERTKLWCLQNNHQVVSSVSGESWPLEPHNIRQKYNDLAKIERKNHQAAHPGYKFSPSKTQANRKRKGTKDEDEGSILGEFDEGVGDLGEDGSALDGGNAGGGGGGGGGRRRNARMKKPTAKPNSTALGYLRFPYENSGDASGAQRSSFNHNNPGKTPPLCMGAQDMVGQYYQTTVRASSATPMPNPMPSAVIEDVTIRKTQAPSHPLSLHMNPNGSGDVEYHQQFPPIKREPGLEDNSKVDPVLLGDDRPYMLDHYHHQHQQALSGQFLGETQHYGLENNFDPTFAVAAQPDHHQHMIEANYAGGGVMPMEGGAIPYGGDDILDGTIDVHKLPGYSPNMGCFLDNQEPWSFTTEDSQEQEEGVDLCYDEWLQ